MPFIIEVNSSIGWLEWWKTSDFQEHLSIIIYTLSIMKELNHLTNQKININELLKDYELDFSLFTDIDDRLLAIEDKWESLELPYKILLILYAEYGSLRKVASLLGFSHTTIAKEINKLRERLLC